MQTRLDGSLAGRGESLVADYLSNQGFSIIERNFRVRKGEIDIIVRRGSLVCFIEVKTRQSVKRGRGVFAVTKHKMNRLVAAAKVFVARNRECGCRYRFDVAEVDWREQEPRINYFKNVIQVD